jgi:lysophospholipid acyltransferase (LPLAT)-like uncharacterized protein
MRLSRRLLKRPWVQACIAWFAAQYIRLVHRSTRWRQEMPPATRSLLEGGEPFIACFWHSRILIMRAAWRGRPQDCHLLISGHTDGAIIARSVSHLGFPTIVGSSRKRGSQALREIERRIREGTHCVGITPDGPRGPRMRVKPGAVKAAQITGAPIVPISGSARRALFMPSWDRFCVALPFTRGSVLWGEPVTVPRRGDDATLERLRGELEERLNALTRQADEAYGHEPIEPAPPRPGPDPKSPAGKARARAAAQEAASESAGR